jgi:hypothetical protein
VYILFFGLLPTDWLKDFWNENDDNIVFYRAISITKEKQGEVWQLL